MFKFLRRKSKKEKILEKSCEFKSFREFLTSLSNTDLHELGRNVVFSKFDGYNLASCDSEMCYFDNLDRWQKEFFIDQRRHYL